MMKDYFSLQYKRILRLIDHLGIKPIIGIPIIGLLFYVISNSLFQKTEYASYIYILLSFSFFNVLSGKRRNDFLKLIYSRTLFYKIRICENLLFSLPFIFFTTFQNEYIASLSIFTIAILSSFNNSHKTINFTIPTPFYKKPFEFTIGFRKSFYIYPIAYSLTGISIYVGNFNLGIFSLIVSMLPTIFNFYSKSEEKYYVWIHSFPPSTFIFHKIKIALVYSILLISPIVISLLITFISNYYVTISFMVHGLLVIITTILIKYAFYPYDFNLMQGIVIFLCIFFPPALLFVIPYLYIRSKNNLSTLLS